MRLPFFYMLSQNIHKLDSNKRVRINKFLAEHGIASRRAIDELISKKRITVNGVLLEKPGCLVGENDFIVVDGKKIIKKQKKNVSILLNKPLNCITTASDPHGRKTVMSYIKSDVRVFPIGRLDKNTTGVLILTNDGDLANTLMHPKYSVEKMYHATLNKEFTDTHKKVFEMGVVLDGVNTAACSTRFLKNDRRQVIVTLHEGKNRQIHRMFGALGFTVQKLERIRYAGLDARGVKEGEWRYLTEKEVEGLKQVYEVK